MTSLLPMAATPAPDVPERARPSILREISTIVAAVVLLAIVLGAVLAHVIAPHGYDDQQITNAFAAPTWLHTHPLGTDNLGRDVLVRTLYGGRPALAISTIAAVLATLLGLVLTYLAVLGGRFWDGLLGRIADIQLAIPTVLLSLVVLAFVGSGMVPLVVVLTIGAWVLTFRITRSHAGRIAALPYIEAARLAGGRWPSILRRHLLPASAPLVAVAFTLNFSATLVLESSLGYLGLGVQPPKPDWGQMVASGQAQLAGAWWIAIVPGVFIVLTVVAVQILGDRLADLLALSTDGDQV